LSAGHVSVVGFGHAHDVPGQLPATQGTVELLEQWPEEFGGGQSRLVG